MPMLTRVALACVLACAIDPQANVNADHVVEVAVGAQGGFYVDGPHVIPVDSPSHERQSLAADDAQQDQLLPPTKPIEEPSHHEKQQQSPRATNQVNTALVKELEALELMITLQAKKLALLEKIRSKALSEHVTSVSAASSVYSQSNRQANERFEDLIGRKIEAVTASAIEEFMAAAPSQSASFDALFVAKAVIPTPQALVDMKMMKLRLGGHQELLVLAFANGAIEFYLPPSSSLLLRITQPDKLIIRAIELDLHSDSPSLAVIFKQPQAVVYALELTENGRHLMGSQPDNATFIDATAEFTSAPGTKFSLKVAELSRIQLSAAPNALAITKTARRSVLTIGDDDGRLQFIALNGTLLHAMATSATIQTMAAQRNLVAFNNGSSTVLLPLSRGREAAFVICEGSTAEVTSIAFDALHSDVVYAGTSHGEVLAFSTRDSGGGGGVESPGGTCKMVTRVLLREYQAAVGRQRHQQTNTRVYMLKGFLIASTGSTLAVYNVSRSQDGAVSMEVVCTLPIPATVDGDKAPNLPLAVSEGNYVTNLVFAFDEMTGGDGSGGRVTVFQSLLSSRVEKSNTSWVGALYIAIIITVVLVSQFCFRRSQSTQSPSTFDPWGIQKNRKEPEFVHVGARTKGSLFGGEDTGIAHEEQEEESDLEYLSQEMRASMNSRTARDVADKGGALKQPTSTRPLSDRERFGPSYDALSDDLKRKIAEAREGTPECAFDDPEDLF